MGALGLPPQQVLPGVRGEPQWPKGVVGSITHCTGYRAAVVGASSEGLTIGIDAEPDRGIASGVLEAISKPEERDAIRALAREHPGPSWDRLLFSAKESVYKAWFPLTGKWLDFTEADIEILVDPAERSGGTLHARLLVPGPLVGGERRGVLEGRWTVRGGLVATSVTVPHA